MATIYNTDLTKELKEGARIQQMKDVIPSQLAEKVVPVMEVNPKLLRRCNILFSGNSTASSGTASIGTTIKPFYLVAAMFSLQKDVTSDNTSAYLQITTCGQAKRIIEFQTLSLTAVSKELSISFPNPIKVDSGTNIVIGATFTAANLARSAAVQGYYDEIENA